VSYYRYLPSPIDCHHLTTYSKDKQSKKNGEDDTKPAETEKEEEPKSSPKKKDHHPKTKTTPKKSKSHLKEEQQRDEAADEEKEQEGGAEEKPKKEDQPTTSKNTKSSTSSSILEKGIIYFFLRGRVNTDSPSSVSEIARTYFVLRPTTSSSSNKPANHARLLAVPKKTFPKTGRERWISFVEKSGVSFPDLKDKFLKGDEHETKTRGTQHTPPAKPEGEGVYAITTTGRESHLCYILTRPDDLGEVQKKLGLKDKGSFIITTRNPEFPPPGGVGRLPEGPEFPEE